MMATSSSEAASSEQLSRSSSSRAAPNTKGRGREEDDDDAGDAGGSSSHDALASASSIPVETLVEHLLQAKRSLSSMDLVLRANELTTLARSLHEESAVLGAQTAFLRAGIDAQLRVLVRVRRGLVRTYDDGKRDFKGVIRALDAANGRLEKTIKMLRATIVDSSFRPEGEEAPKNLMDFVDENSVDQMRNALKDNIAELQAAQQSFDGDLLRFDTELRDLNKALSSIATSAPSPSSSSSSSSSTAYRPIPHLLTSLTEHSHSMAEHLASLTHHFDMCVTAVRTTEGGAALARRKAAADAASADDTDNPVSISGVIAEQESHVADLEPLSAQERAEIVHIVVNDAAEVDDVVADIDTALQLMESDFASLSARADRVRAAQHAAAAAFAALDDAGSRLPSYVAAEAEFLARWAAERDAIAARLDEMEELRAFYDGYASAYDTLILEAARRRGVEERVAGLWRRAAEAVGRLVEDDRAEREVFQEEIGEYLPTDLWAGMHDPLVRWEVVPVRDGGSSREQQKGGAGDGAVDEAAGRSSTLKGLAAGSSTPVLDRSVVEAARERLNRSGGGGR